MRYCKNCGVKLTGDLKWCPLCDMETSLLDDRFDEDYPYIKPRVSGRLFFKAVTFTVAVIIIISFLVDHLLPFNGSWPLFVTAGILYGWLSFAVVLRRPRDPGAVVFSQLILLSLLSAVIDRLCGWMRWSVNYVIPALIGCSAIAIVLCISIRLDRYRAYTIYQMIIALAGAIPVVLWLTGLSEIEWTAAAAAATAVLCFAVILVFFDRHTRSELKKRFHF